MSGQVLGTDLSRRVAELEWYHSIELAPGTVTPGWFDTRSVAAALPIPRTLAGKRCLDVGTFDGFWAFEMERRGGVVTAVDVPDPADWDWPVDSPAEAREVISQRKAAGEGFVIAREAIGSSVERIACNVYDLDPDEIGTFDFVYVGSLLLHLRDPIRALERVRSVARGPVLLVDAVDLGLSVVSPKTPRATFDGLGRPWWWKPNLAGLRRMVMSAGFRDVQRARPFFMPPGQGQQVPGWREVLRSRNVEVALTSLRGDPHAYVAARSEPR
jgi:tRNA (mo5U34)-methyltransferase